MTLWLQCAITMTLVVIIFAGSVLADDFLRWSNSFTLLPEEIAAIEIVLTAVAIFGGWYLLHLIWGF